MTDIEEEFNLFDNHEDLENLLCENNIHSESICVVGSSCLAVRNLRPNNDIDIIIHPEIKDQLTIESESNIEIRENGYENLGISDYEVVTDSSFHEIIHGWKIIRPEIEFCHKKYKFDRDDIDLLEDHKATSGEWNDQLVKKYRPRRLDILTNRWFWKKTRDSVLQEGIWTTLKKIPNAFISMLRK